MTKFTRSLLKNQIITLLHLWSLIWWGTWDWPRIKRRSFMENSFVWTTPMKSTAFNFCFKHYHVSKSGVQHRYKHTHMRFHVLMWEKQKPARMSILDEGKVEEQSLSRKPTQGWRDRFNGVHEGAVNHRGTSCVYVCVCGKQRETHTQDTHTFGFSASAWCQLLSFLHPLQPRSGLNNTLFSHDYYFITKI